MQNAFQGSFGFPNKGQEGDKELKDPFQARTGPFSFQNNFGNHKGNDYNRQGLSQDPFRSSVKPSGSGFYRNHRNYASMDVSWSNDDARGRGRVTYNRGRGRTGHQDSRPQRSEGWTKDPEVDQVSWPFTCYGLESSPNTLEGDISFEELRAEAYAASLQGVGLNEIVQRERDLATEYRNRQTRLFSNTTNSNAVFGTQSKDPFGRTVSINSSGNHPFQTTNSFSSNPNTQGGMSVFSVPHSSNSGYSNLFQGFPQHNNENTNISFLQTGDSHEKQPTTTLTNNIASEMKQPSLSTFRNDEKVSNWISPLEQTKLSQEDIEQYRASVFQLGNVPEIAPCKELI